MKRKIRNVLILFVIIFLLPCDSNILNVMANTQIVSNDFFNENNYVCSTCLFELREGLEPIDVDYGTQENYTDGKTLYLGYLGSVGECVLCGNAEGVHWYIENIEFTDIVYSKGNKINFEVTTACTNCFKDYYPDAEYYEDDADLYPGNHHYQYNKTIWTYNQADNWNFVECAICKTLGAGKWDSCEMLPSPDGKADEFYYKRKGYTWLLNNQDSKLYQYLIEFDTVTLENVRYGWKVAMDESTNEVYVFDEDGRLITIESDWRFGLTKEERIARIKETNALYFDKEELSTFARFYDSPSYNLVAQEGWSVVKEVIPNYFDGNYIESGYLIINEDEIIETMGLSEPEYHTVRKVDKWYLDIYGNICFIDIEGDTYKIRKYDALVEQKRPHPITGDNDTYVDYENSVHYPVNPTLVGGDLVYSKDVIYTSELHNGATLYVLNEFNNAGLYPLGDSVNYGWFGYTNANTKELISKVDANINMFKECYGYSASDQTLVVTPDMVTFNFGSSSGAYSPIELTKDIEKGDYLITIRMDMSYEDPTGMMKIDKTQSMDALILVCSLITSEPQSLAQEIYDHLYVYGGVEPRNVWNLGSTGDDYIGGYDHKLSSQLGTNIIRVHANYTEPLPEVDHSFDIMW